jgi:hypothetical protein
MTRESAQEEWRRKTIEHAAAIDAYVAKGLRDGWGGPEVATCLRPTGRKGLPEGCDGKPLEAPPPNYETKPFLLPRDGEGW